MQGVDFTVAAGSIYGLLGPNGAGKTTVVRILSTLIAPDAGSVRIDGHDLVTQPHRVRAAIGVTGQFAAVDDLLTGEENLRLIADLHHLGRRKRTSRVTELLDVFGLGEVGRRRAGTYSGGMRRRLDIAMSLVGRPRVLFLDEPTTGLDPGSRRDTWALVRDLAAGGTTVVLTTQYLEEADELADTVGVLHGGLLVAQGSPADLKQRVGGGRVEVTLEGSQEVLRIPSDGSVASLKAILAGLEDTSAVTHLNIHTPNLDDVFFALTASDTK
ncbi:ATP-binding cassette domain-containing protein [Mycolicibacterium mageritense]|nr:ATP-binding cassette domain-containing protein [Mycolicibacterium mageritense]MCC9186127.1 ATP-binding cassette domain-containing protein [Mycolicibacterium mageritense]